MTMKLIHFGASKFDPALMEPISNGDPFTETVFPFKPNGGLWTCPVEAKWGWKNWCEDNQMRLENLESHFKLQLYSGARILVINSYDDLESAHSEFGTVRAEFRMETINFENVSKDFDAVHLTETGNSATHSSRPFNLNSWDCECVLVLNRASVVID